MSSSCSPYCSRENDDSRVEQECDVLNDESKKEPSDIPKQRNVELDISFEKKASSVEKQERSESDNNQESVVASINELNRL